MADSTKKAPAPLSLNKPPVDGERKPPKSPRQRFEALATKRVQKLLKAMVAVSRIGNPAQYEMHDWERAQILEALEDGCRRMTAALKGEKKVEGGFQFVRPQ